MTFPASKRVVFQKNPLEQVVCQLRFPTILEISAEMPAKFQNLVRDQYPLYERDQPKVPKQIEEMIAHLPLQLPREAGTHKFTTADGNKSISLASEFVAFTDKKYEHWEKFSREVERARRALEDIYKPAFYTRIGLRYKDVIDREDLGLQKTPWESLLKPSLLGLLGAKEEVGKHVNDIATQASIDLEEIEGAHATIQHGLGRRMPDNRQVYIVDMDVYTEERSESHNVAKILAEFNKLAGNFFRWAITDVLHAALEPRPVSPGS